MEKILTTLSLLAKEAAILGLICELSPQEQIEVLHATLMEVSNRRRRNGNEQRKRSDFEKRFE